MSIDDPDRAVRCLAAYNRSRERYPLRPEPRRSPSIFRRVAQALREFLTLDPWRSDR